MQQSASQKAEARGAPASPQPERKAITAGAENRKGRRKTGAA